MKDALWFGLLDHRGRLMRVPASVCGAYDCLVYYVRWVEGLIPTHRPDSRLSNTPFLQLPCG